MIIPAKNEERILPRCLESLRNVDYPKDRIEMIIANGLSSDHTHEAALRYGAKVVLNERQIVVSGRNRGFEAATGDVIAFTDADCIFDPQWLRNSLKYFGDKQVGGVGGTILTAEESSSFERAVVILFGLAEHLQATIHLQNVVAVRDVADIPGCCAIYRKDVLSEVMPVDENLLTAEDVWMNACIRKRGYKLILAPDVMVRHNHRSSPRAFLRQMYRFAIGRLQVGKRDRTLLGYLHILAGLGLPFFFLAAGSLCILGQVLFLLALGFVLVGVLGALAFRRARSLRVAANFPLVVLLFVLAWSGGFLRELFLPIKDAKGK